VTTHLEGESREVGRIAAALAKDLPAGRCLVLGGETTVTLRGSGTGGRNLETALAAGIALDGWPNRAIATFATDGEDGPSGAAGAIVDGLTHRRAQELGMDSRGYLDDNNSLRYFEGVGGLIRTGPTGTNVNDLIFVFHYQDGDALGGPANGWERET
jgi:hydroxypyruvate reductase